MSILKFVLSALMVANAAPVVSAVQICRAESEIPSSVPTANFTDNGDGTVLDHATGLMWMKCPLGQSGNYCLTGTAASYTWKEALEVAETTSFAGHEDWRLPDIKELRSIVEARCSGPATNGVVFPWTPASYFWSSSPSAYGVNLAWAVNFAYGESGRDTSTRDIAMHVRLVRPGQ